MILFNISTKLSRVEVAMIKQPSKKTLMKEYIKDNNIVNYAATLMIFI